MTHTFPRPLAALLAACAALTLWLPTVSAPAAHATPNTVLLPAELA